MRVAVQRELVERAQGGDRESFRALAEASIGRLFSVAQMMLADADLAEDAVQETLIVTWRDLRGLRDADRFDAWLHRILVRSVYRVAKRERREGIRWQVVTDVAALPDVAGEIANRDQIERGFRQLKAEHRAALVVHHYLGLSDDEAASVLGVPPGTFKSRLHRATLALRAALEADARVTQQLATGTVR